jgi:hypothetical protein
VSLRFGDLTAHAGELVSRGDLVGARRLLGEALAAVDPDPVHAGPELAEAADLQARVLVALGQPHPARGWAGFAHAAGARLYGTSDPRTIASAATLAAVLHRVGDQAAAAELYRAVIIELTALDGPESLRVLAAHADLATVEYALGDCAVARERLGDAWELHREVYGDGHLSGIKMLARLGAMERDCGRSGPASEHFALARELCRTHLPAGHPLAGQVAALAGEGADPHHVCTDFPAGRPPPGTGTGWSAPGPDTGPAEYPGVDPDHPDPGWRAEWGLDPPWAPEADAGAWPDPDAPTEPEHPVAAEPYGPPGDHDGPARGRDRHRPTRLPVAAHRAPRQRNRWTMPVALAGALTALLGAGAVVTGFTVGDDEPGPGGSSPGAPGPPSTTPAPTPSPAAPGTPPGALRLRDDRDSVSLSWTYPAGAQGSVVVAGGRVGQQPRPFQELPAGSDTFTVYGLDRDRDYCFTVSVLYPANRVGRTESVCTVRRRRSPRG